MARKLVPHPKQSATPSGEQRVVVVAGAECTGSVRAPSNHGTIWFSFNVGAGKAALTVSFNGVNYLNVPPGQYTLQNLKTPLSLDVTVSGSATLAWINS